MIAGDDSDEALEQWREHRDDVHHRPDPVPEDLVGAALISRLRQVDGPVWTWAARAVGEYFHTTTYSGRWFERLGRTEPAWNADAFTPTDVVAVEMLGVTLPPDAILALLDADFSRRLTRLLCLIDDVPLHEIEFAALGEGSPADDLYHEIKSLHGLARTKTSKLLARKRPHLIPVYDDRVAHRLATGDQFWAPMHDLMQDEALVVALERLRRAVGGVGDISLLRILDVAVWRYDKALRPLLRTT